MKIEEIRYVVKTTYEGNVYYFSGIEYSGAQYCNMVSDIMDAELFKQNKKDILQSIQKGEGIDFYIFDWKYNSSIDSEDIEDLKTEFVKVKVTIETV